MGLVTKPHNPQNGETNDVTLLNDNDDVLYNVINGNLDDDNFANITINDSNNTTGDTAKPGTLFSRIAYSIKSILGTTNWFDDIPISLTALKTLYEDITDENGDVNQYKGNDIDTDGDGKVDNAVNADSAIDANNVTGTYKGNDIDSDGDGKVDSAIQADNTSFIDPIYYLTLNDPSTPEEVSLQPGKIRFAINEQTDRLIAYVGYSDGTTKHVNLSLV